MSKNESTISPAEVRKHLHDSVAKVSSRVRSEADAAFAVDLMETVAKMVQDRHSAANLPTAEREVWAAVGASFDGAARPLPAQPSPNEAFALFVQQCVRGDAAAADLLEVHPSRISQRLRSRSLYAVATDSGRLFPRWQFDGAATIPGLADVLAVLDPGLHPFVVDHWFTTPSTELEINDAPVNPRDWLATGGDVARVVALARDL
jgi:hypothetical protein